MTMDQPLSKSQKDKLCQIVAMGCDRDTACQYHGLSADQLHALMHDDEQFARELLRSEAQAEVLHMGNIKKASQDEKNWRSSVWWLERRDQDRDHADEPENLTPEVSAALERFVEIVVAEITDDDQRESLRQRLLQLVDQTVETQP